MLVDRRIGRNRGLARRLERGAGLEEAPSRRGSWLQAIAGGALLLLAGCGAQQGAPLNPSYSPYDPETNPFCGALGTCRPLITEPYAIPGNRGGE